MSSGDSLYVLAAPYARLADAEEDFAAIETLYVEPRVRGFDAVVLERDADGQVLVVEDRTSGAGLAIGVAAALFPPIGVGAALALGNGGGAIVAAVVGHVHADIPPDELRRLAEMLEAADAGLIVVYDDPLSRKVERAVSSESCTVIRSSPVDVAQLIREADPAVGLGLGGR
jgi:uncharacterized membrane protein